LLNALLTFFFNLGFYYKAKAARIKMTNMNNPAKIFIQVYQIFLRNFIKIALIFMAFLAIQRNISSPEATISKDWPQHYYDYLCESVNKNGKNI